MACESAGLLAPIRSLLDFVVPVDQGTRSVLFVVSDVESYMDFAKGMVETLSIINKTALYVMIDGMISQVFEESKGRTEVLVLSHLCQCENEIEMTKEATDALSRIERFDLLIFDPISIFSTEFSEDSAPAHFIEQIAPLIHRRKMAGYFCLQMEVHQNETVARAKDIVDLCIQLTCKDNVVIAHIIKARGAYSPDLFIPHEYTDWPLRMEKVPVSDILPKGKTRNVQSTQRSIQKH